MPTEEEDFFKNLGIEVEENDSVKNTTEEENKDKSPEVIENEKIVEESNNLEEQKKEREEEEDNSNPNIYSGIVDLIKEEAGLFANFDKKIEKPEDLIEGIRFEILEGIEDYKNSLPREFKQIIEGAEAGVDWTTMKALKANEVKLNSVSDSDIENNEDVAKDIFIAHLKATTNWNEYKISREYQKALDLEEVAERAKEGLDELKAINSEDERRVLKEAEERVRREQEEFKQSLINLKRDVYETKDLIPNVKLSDKDKADLFTQMTKPVEFDGYGNGISKVQAIREKNPVQFEKMLNLLVMKGVFDEKPNFDFIVKPTKTNTIKKLEETAQRELELRKSGQFKNIEKSNFADQLGKSLGVKD
jgi:hypothetical protein